MHDDSARVVARLDRLLRERIQPAAIVDRQPLEIRAWRAPGEPVSFAEGAAAAYEAFRAGDPWGAHWSTWWFAISGVVPAKWAGRHVEAEVDLGFRGTGPGFAAEALVFERDGSPVKGLEPLNRWLPVCRVAGGGEQVDWLVEATANPDIFALPGPGGEGDRLTSSAEPAYRFECADLVVIDDETRSLAYDLDVLGGLIRHLGGDDPRRFEIIRAVDRALDRLDPQGIRAGAGAARAELVEVLSRPAVPSAHRVSAVGHAHIDTAWLWPLRESVRKVGRTMANVVQLAQDYPDLVFAMPQAQQMAWLKEHHPETWARVLPLIAEGRVVPVGGMWVEADGNLPGGESLVRQLVYGKRFFRDECGVTTRGVWLPDSFGYTAAYPQLAKLAGNDWFLTQKLSWNATNAFPHHTFWWEGIDGSRIFTHFPPTDTYGGDFSVGELLSGVKRFREKGRATRSLYPFGYGDGGGGPHREMLERSHRLADLEGAPRIVIESPDAFFAAAQAEYPHAPVWSGELYLELHRGTFTSQQRTKQGNRFCEHRLRELELWATTAAVAARAADPGEPGAAPGAPAYAYPYDELDRIWREVLTLQFHDILPGSSIRWVHREAEERYAVLLAELDGLIADAAAALATGEGWSVLNAGPFPRLEVVDVGGSPELVSAPALGAGSVVSVVDSGVAPVKLADTDSGWVIDNALIQVRIDRLGNVTGIRDLPVGRDLLAGGRVGNVLQLHDDVPNKWDAWDVDAHYRNRVTDLVSADSVVVEESGPLRGVVRVCRSVGSTSIVQRLVVRAGSERLDVVTDIDWQETEKLLKVAFPLDVHALVESAEIQFGHVQRPTHVNTSWDTARFEVPAHRWIHVGEPGFGVAIVTDTTYGHDVSRTTEAGGSTTTTVRLSLLRAPVKPDPLADRGRHRFTYGIAPAATVLDAARHGYEINLPLRVAPYAIDRPPLVRVERTSGPPSALVEAIKLADGPSGDVVIRLYEAAGARTSARLHCAFPVEEVAECDLLEEPLLDDGVEHRPAPGQSGTESQPIDVDVRPFQVTTLRVTCRS